MKNKSLRGQSKIKISKNFNQDLDKDAFNIILCGFKGTGKTTLLIRYLEGIYSQNIKRTIGVNKQTENIFFDKNLQKVFTEKEFSQKINKTKSKNLDKERFNKYSLVYWDLAGSSKFNHIRTTYMKQADAILLLYSLNDKYSFLDNDQINDNENRAKKETDCSIGKYVTELYSALGKRVKEIPFLIIGTKNDLKTKVDLKHVNYIVRKLSESGLNIVLWKYKDDNKDIKIRFSQEMKSTNGNEDSNDLITYNSWISTSSKTDINVDNVFKIIQKSLIGNK